MNILNNMSQLQYRDFKHLEYDDDLPMEIVLADLMFKGMLNTNTIMECYTMALERERHLNESKFEEACINLTQILSGNFKGKHKKAILKRAVHTFNLTRRLPKNIHNAQYEYTDEDKAYWDEVCKTLYGIDLEERSGL